jgi:hypothetical protein
MTTTVAAKQLPKLNTPDLIEQYDLAVAKRGFRPMYNAETGVPTPRQQRINRIVDMISARADAEDANAIAWLDAAV